MVLGSFRLDIWSGIYLALASVSLPGNWSVFGTEMGSVGSIHRCISGVSTYERMDALLFI